MVKSQTEKMYELLVKGYPPEKVRAKYPRRGATLAKAIQMYLEWAPPRIKKLQGEISPLTSQVASLEGDIRLKNEQNVELDRQILEMKEEKQSLQGDLEKTEEEIRRRREALKHTEDLSAKGVSFDLIARIHSMEVESGKEVTSRINTVEAYEREKKVVTELTRKMARLEKHFANLKKEKNKAEKELKNIKENIRFQQNELDDERKKTRLYRKLIGTTQGFIDDGYSFESLKSLRSSLKAISIKGKPKRSLSRLIEGFQGFKTLDQLYDEVGKAETKLETLNKKIGMAESIFDVYKTRILTVLDEALEKGLKSVRDLHKELTRKQDNQFSSHTNELNKIIKTMTDNINKIGGTASGITAFLHAEVKRASTNLKNNIFIINQQFKKDTEKYNTLKDKIRDHEILGKYGYYLLGVLKYPEEIKDIPLPIIAQLMGRIHSYIQVNFPDMKAFPSKTASKGWSGLSTYTKYDVSNIAVFLKEELIKKSLESAKSEPQTS